MRKEKYAGTAQGYDVTINGIGNYRGSIVKKFRVAPKGALLIKHAKVTGIAKSCQYPGGEAQGNADRHPTVTQDGNITVKVPDDVKYAKGGAKPQPVIIYINNGIIQTLREDVDYKLTYSNPTSVGEKNKPTLKITGIETYCGTVTEQYDIAKQDIGKLTITAADKAYNMKKQGSCYYSVPKVYDLDGKQLKQKTDYTVQYFDAATGQEIGKKDTVANGALIRVTVTATENSNYIGMLSTTYLVRDAKDVKHIAKTKADLTKDTDYEINGYYNNIKRGTAAILIRGINDYSGVKSITFKISATENDLIWSGAF